MLTGQPTHGHGLVQDVVNRAALPVTLDPKIKMHDILAKALAHDPADRFASVSDFQTALTKWRQTRGVDRLLTQTMEKVTALKALADEQNPSRASIYDLYGACRFGLQEVITARPELTKAHKALAETIEAMISYELGCQDHRAAELLLARHPKPPLRLSQRVAALKASNQHEREAAQALLHQHDPATALWGRIALVGGMSAIWLFTPILTTILGVPNGYPREISVSGISFVLTAVGAAALFPWVRSSQITKT